MEFTSILSILIFTTVYKNVGCSCYYYFDGYNNIRDCSYKREIYTKLSICYGSMFGVGVIVGVIVWCCCAMKKNQDQSNRTINAVVVPRTGNHATQNPYIMMGPTQYGSRQEQVTRSGRIPSNNSGALGYPAGTFQP
ncbi:uncharacterized protein LOC134231446 [Saccostrea cucullata]|uniref:uncharacterized protein LOC134231446 n=1 Tax=Saccostrea cuccullata TaxID=36930 RepID=UPI002ED5F67E